MKKVIVAAMLPAAVMLPGPAAASDESLRRELRELREEIRRDQDARDTDRDIRDYQREQERQQERRAVEYDRECRNLTETGRLLAPIDSPCHWPRPLRPGR
jgi:hypothetical protein